MKNVLRGLTACVLVVGLLEAAVDLRLIDAIKHQDRDAIRTLLKQRLDVNAAEGMARPPCIGRLIATMRRQSIS